MIELKDFLLLALIQLLAVTVWFLASYVKERGKNLATREDVHEITRQIESAKIEYAKELEGLKSQLNVKYHAHTVRFEKEFQVLQELWKCVVNLRSAGEAFTPGFKNLPDESECKERFAQAHNALLQLINEQQPFFPQEIFDLLNDYRKRWRRYFTDHEFITKSSFQKDWVSPEFWDKREENLKEIRKLVDDVCEAIRTRIWNSGE